jgi:hypothetical protein
VRPSLILFTLSNSPYKHSKAPKRAAPLEGPFRGFCAATIATTWPARM